MNFCKKNIINQIANIVLVLIPWIKLSINNLFSLINHINRDKWVSFDGFLFQTIDKHSREKVCFE